MAFRLFFTPRAASEMQVLQNNPALVKRYKAVRAALGKLEGNPRHPGLNTHKFDSMKGPKGEEVFEAYAENNTPGAYRIFWCYGPEKMMMSILAVTPHP